MKKSKRQNPTWPFIVSIQGTTRLYSFKKSGFYLIRLHSYINTVKTNWLK
jgi:hypothetical protein